jgi:hypothetical protein
VPVLPGWSNPVMRKGTRQKPSCRRARSNKTGNGFPGIALKYERPAAIRLAGRNGQDARDLRERMDAILKPETMAGSPDADAVTRAASRHLAHGFLFCGVSSFRKLMKEDCYV